MFGTIMSKMAPLTKRGKITRMIVARIVIKMGAGEHDPC
jgi:hypothetical protein